MIKICLLYYEIKIIQENSKKNSKVFILSADLWRF